MDDGRIVGRGRRGQAVDPVAVLTVAGRNAGEGGDVHHIRTAHRTTVPHRPTEPTDRAEPPAHQGLFLDFLPLVPGDVLLDIGCGDGRVLVAACLKYGCKGIGIDISKECLEAAESMASAESARAVS